MIAPQRKLRTEFGLQIQQLYVAAPVV